LGGKKMKKSLSFLLIFFLFSNQVFAQYHNVPVCRFLSNPVRDITWNKGEGVVDNDDGVDWDREVVVISDSPRVIRVFDRNGKESTCLAPAGIAFIADKNSHIANRVFLCLNPVERFRVSGISIEKQNKQLSINLLREQISFLLLYDLDRKLDKISNDIASLNYRVDNINNYLSEIKNSIPKNRNSKKNEKKTWGKKWLVIPLMMAIVIGISSSGGSSSGKSNRSGPPIP
jgi:hypothetical protein